MTIRYFFDLFLNHKICFEVFLLLIIFLDVVWNLGKILIYIKRSHIFFHITAISLLSHSFSILILHENYVLKVLLDEVAIIFALFGHLNWVIVFFFTWHHFEGAVVVLIANSFALDVWSYLVLGIRLHELDSVRVLIFVSIIALESRCDLRIFISLTMAPKH